MSVAVIGRNGARFEAPIWTRPAIWHAASLVVPALANTVRRPTTSCGDGLDGGEARVLGEALLAYLGAIGQEVFWSAPGRAVAAEATREQVAAFARFAIASGGFQIW